MLPAKKVVHVQDVATLSGTASLVNNMVLIICMMAESKSILFTNSTICSFELCNN